MEHIIEAEFARPSWDAYTGVAWVDYAADTYGIGTNSIMFQITSPEILLKYRKQYEVTDCIRMFI